MLQSGYLHLGTKQTYTIVILVHFLENNSTPPLPFPHILLYETTMEDCCLAVCKHQRDEVFEHWATEEKLWKYTKEEGTYKKGSYFERVKIFIKREAFHKEGRYSWDGEPQLLHQVLAAPGNDSNFCQVPQAGAQLTNLLTWEMTWFMRYCHFSILM